jgi:hypothetical protein
MPAARLILAVIVASVVGTIATSVAVAALTPSTFLTLVVSPGRNAVALAAAVLLPAIYAGISGIPAAIVAVVALTVIPTVAAKLVFGVDAPWPLVAVYAVTAWVVYLAIGQTAGKNPARGAR